jgi:hypothetical protein
LLLTFQIKKLNKNIIFQIDMFRFFNFSLLSFLILSWKLNALKDSFEDENFDTSVKLAKNHEKNGWLIYICVLSMFIVTLASLLMFSKVFNSI